MIETKVVLSLCDRTTIALRPWAEAGYECWAIDTQHPHGIGKNIDGIRLVGCDISRFAHHLIEPLNRTIAFVSAFPPCTHLASSGARWFRKKGLDLLADAIRLVAACNRICEASSAPFYIENPIGTLSTYWRKPDYIWNPCDYAGYLDDPSVEAYTKRTCLWTGGGFVMPKPRYVEPVLGSKMHKLPPTKDRADIRSITPLGFSLAVFASNSGLRK